MHSISFIGGDKRSYYLSQMYSLETEVHTYGLGIDKESLESCINKSEYIALPIPFSTDGKNLFLPLGKENIPIDLILGLLRGKIIICGKLGEEHKEKLISMGNKVIDIMKNESFVLKNTIPTAEGVLKTIIEKTDFTMDNSKIAVIGYGRVGKKICELLKAMNTNVFCYDIKKEEVANIELSGYNVLGNICDELPKMDVIINTAPTVVLNRQILELIKKDTLIVDVASYPGGVDYEYSKSNNYNVIQQLGIPGKTAPKTVAMYMKEEIDKILM